MAVVVLTVLMRPCWPLDRLDALVAPAIVRRRSTAGIHLANLGSALGEPATDGASRCGRGIERRCRWRSPRSSG